MEVFLRWERDKPYNMKRKKMIILPALYDAGGDVSKKWFVHYSIRNPRTNKMERFKVFTGLGKTDDPHQRLQIADQLIISLTDKLRHGWTPWSDDSKVIYDDHLEYQNIVRIYGTKRAKNKTVRYYASQYLDAISGRLDPDGTLGTYRSKLRIFTNWVDAQTDPGNDICAVTNAMVIRFFTWLIIDQNRSGKTVHDYHYILAGFFEWMVSKKIFASNPVHDIPECNRICDMAPSPIQAFDIEVFKNELLNDPQLWLAVQFQYYCALRPGRELRLLKIKDIDFASGSVTVRRSQAKTKVTRTVVIPHQFLTSLCTDFKLMDYEKDFFVFGKNGVPGPCHLGKNNLRFRFNDVRKKLNMPEEYKFYSWKHTGAVQASLSGIPDSHIQRQMGHSSIDTTSRYLRKMTGFQSDFLINRFPSI